MNATILAAALSTLMSVPQETDTLIAVPGGVRITVEQVAGDVTVTTWSQNQVRVLADHGSDDTIELELDGNELSISAHSNTGMAIVDFELTVPVSAALEISAPFADVRITGTQGNVSVQTVEGDIHVEGGRGQVDLQAVAGDVMVFGSEATVQAASVDGDVMLTDVSGDVEAQTVDGDVILKDASSDNVQAATVDGDILWDGDILDSGRYSFVTHDGDIIVGVQPGANAKVSVASFDADFEIDFEASLEPGEQESRRFSFVLGSGSARMELESFDGSIHLTRRGHLSEE